MTLCAACGAANDSDARFCSACGRALGGSPAANTKRRSIGRFRLPAELERILPALLVLAFVLGLISLGTAWWSYSSSTSSGSLSVNFVPGGSYYVSCSASRCAGFSSGSFPYAALGGGSIGSMYATVEGLLGLAVALAGVVAVLRVLAAWGRFRTSLLWTSLLSLASVIVLLATMAWTATSQPGALPAGVQFSGTGGSGPSPATSFWGSTANGNASWGAGAGWYLALAMILLLLAVLVLQPLLDRRRAATTRSAARPARDVAAPAALPRYTAPPPPVPITRSPVTRPPIPGRSSPPPEPAPTPASALPVPPPPPESTAEMVPCPECGTPNLARSRVCSYCQRPLGPRD